MFTPAKSQACWFALADRESAACDYDITVGHLYCRPCGGSGVVGEGWTECPDCHGQGELKHPEWSTP